jgi:hypothetical protein
MNQVREQTYKEKKEMFLESSKEELVEFLEDGNLILDYFQKSKNFNNFFSLKYDELVIEIKNAIKQVKKENYKNYFENAYNKYGLDNFSGGVEIECESVDQLDYLEESFLKGNAWFEEPSVYNIADFAKAPMRGKTHSDEVRERIRLGRRASTFDYKSLEYRKTLSDAQMARFHRDPKFIDKVKFILDNGHMSYAERARQLGSDTSSVRRLALRYTNLKGNL